MRLYSGDSYDFNTRIPVPALNNPQFFRKAGKERIYYDTLVKFLIEQYALDVDFGYLYIGDLWDFTSYELSHITTAPDVYLDPIVYRLNERLEWEDSGYIADGRKTNTDSMEFRLRDINKVGKERIRLLDI